VRSTRAARLALAAKISATLVTLGAAGQARADGAFPDSLSVLVPADRPQYVGLATNFGLISSNDGGASWTWVCEGPITNCSTLYSVSAPPSSRLFAVSADSLVYSDDDACDWKVSGGGAVAGGVVDAFPLAQSSARVLAVVSPNGVGPQTTYTVVSSSDGGVTFGAVLYTAAAGDVVTGVEASRSDANRIYVTIAHGSRFTPMLAVSEDGGATWRTIDLAPSLDQAGIRLIAVDRTNAARVFLRVTQTEAEAFGVFDATNDTLATPLTFPGGLMTSFVQTAEGPLVAAGRLNIASSVHRSLDGGATWQAVAGAPHLRALAERDGTIYGATDDAADGFAIETSRDLGLTFKPLMSYADVGAIAACVRGQCQETCKSEVALGLWPAAVCTATEAKPKAKAGSSGCAVARSHSNVLALAVAALAVLRARRRRG
jgi:hypothetical protein